MPHDPGTFPVHKQGGSGGTLWEKPLISTLLRASSHMSQELSFHTWVAMLYSSISGSCRGQVLSDRCTRPCGTNPPRGFTLSFCTPPAGGSRLALANEIHAFPGRVFKSQVCVTPLSLLTAVKTELAGAQVKPHQSGSLAHHKQQGPC